MEVFYISELYLDISLIIGILSSVFILCGVYFLENSLTLRAKVWRTILSILFFWGPSLFIWVAFELEYVKN